MNNDLSYVHDNVYCIWYPDRPSEETCVKLLNDHPHLKYQVARVCAHYGYNKLFKTLNILPEEGLLSIVEDKPNRELKKYIKLQRKQHKQKLWKVLNDTCGKLTEPQLVKYRSILEREALNLNEIDSIYRYKLYVYEDLSKYSHILDITDITFDFQYYDPLRSGVISFISAQDKVNRYKTN